MWWRRSTERVRTVSLSRSTSVLAMVFCLVVGVGFVFGLCFLGLVVCLCCCVSVFACAPYALLYISLTQVIVNVWICIGETWGVFTLGDTRK